MDEMDRTQKLSRDEIPLKTIPLVCSWCGKIYSIEKWKFEENQRTGVSHGICPDCLERMGGELNGQSAYEAPPEDDASEGGVDGVEGGGQQPR